MSEINANIVVEPINLTITQTDPGITITPEAIDLNIFTGGYACAQGNVNEVQYNAGGYIDGSIGLKYYSANSTTVANTLIVNGNANVGNLYSTGAVNGATSTITGNITAGNVSGGNLVSANYLQGTLITAAQPNITSVGNLTSLTVSGNITAGNANLGNAASANYFIGNGALLTGIDTSQISNGNSNVKVYANANIAISSTGNSNIVVVTGTSVNVAGILNSNANVVFTGGNVSLGNVTDVEIYGGNNGQYLQTDGLGNLSWVSGGGSGNGVVGGSNTQIQYNDAGVFGGSSGFTFDKSSNLFSAPGAATITGNISGANLVSTPIVLPYGIENTSLITAQTGTYNFDLISNAIRFTTSNASANLIVNFRGNSTVTANSLLANGQSIIGTYVMKIGSSAYGITALQVDGSNATINWVNGSSPTFTANTYTSYTFTITKTATTPTYVVFGSATRYA